MKRASVFIVFGLFLALVLYGCAEREEPEVVPAAELTKSIENGKKLFNDASLGTNQMTCNSCHPDGGTKDTKMGDMTIAAFNKLAVKYPAYFGAAKRILTLDQANNVCIKMALKGEALKYDDPRLTDLTAYVASVAAESQIKKKAMPEAAKALTKAVENGKKLFHDTKLGTSGMSCNNCHMEGGTKDGKMGEMVITAFDDVSAKYPKYFMMGKKVMTLGQVVNFCIVNPLKGEALKWDDQKLTDLAAYTASVKATKKD